MQLKLGLRWRVSEFLCVMCGLFFVRNERADCLAKDGAKLRFKLMELAAPHDWFRRSVEDYWANRLYG